MQLTSTVECTHQSLLEESWLRVHRSPHQKQRLLKYNRKGRITQNSAEQSTVKGSNAFKILKFPASVTIYTMPHDSQRAKTLQYVSLYLHYILHFNNIATRTVYIYNEYARGFKHTHRYVHTQVRTHTGTYTHRYVY